MFAGLFHRGDIAKIKQWAMMQFQGSTTKFRTIINNSMITWIVSVYFWLTLCKCVRVCLCRCHNFMSNTTWQIQSPGSQERALGSTTIPLPSIYDYPIPYKLKGQFGPSLLLTSSLEGTSNHFLENWSPHRGSQRGNIWRTIRCMRFVIRHTWSVIKEKNEIEVRRSKGDHPFSHASQFTCAVVFEFGRDQ